MLPTRAFWRQERSDVKKMRGVLVATAVTASVVVGALSDLHTWQRAALALFIAPLVYVLGLGIAERYFRSKPT